MYDNAYFYCQYMTVYDSIDNLEPVYDNIEFLLPVYDSTEFLVQYTIELNP